MARISILLTLLRLKMNEVVSPSVASDVELIRDVFSKSYIFARASKASVDALIKGTVVKSVAKGEALFIEGEFSENVFLLVAGRVTFFMHDEDGKRYTLGLVSDYSIFGEMEIFSKGLRMSHAEAHEDSKVLAIHSAVFNQVVRKDPEILYRIVRFYAAILERLSRYSLFRDVEKQLAYILVDFAHRYGRPVKLDSGSKKQIEQVNEGIEIDVHLPQEFLGSLVGIPRQRINTILKIWEEKLWIKVNYSRVILLNEPALKEYSVI